MPRHVRQRSRTLTHWLLPAWLLATLARIAGADALATPGNSTYTYYSVGEPAAVPASPARPALLLLGGGEWPNDAIHAFVAAAGHGHIVVLRASGDDAAQQDFWSSGGRPRAVSTVVFHDRAAAFDPNVARLLASADGLFIAGGDQANYLRYWTGTPVQTAINGHIRAGKPLAGTSAGLAILGHHAYGCLDGDSMDTPRALANPLRSGNTLVTGFLSLPGLEHVITDSHFAERSRQGRLVAFMARLQHDAPTPDPDLVGLGIDEETGLWIEPTGEARVYSRKNGAVWWIHAPVPATPLVAGQPLGQPGIDLVRLGTESRIRLPPRGTAGKTGDWQLENPLSRARVDIVAGRWASPPPDTMSAR